MQTSVTQIPNPLNKIINFGTTSPNKFKWQEHVVLISRIYTANAAEFQCKMKGNVVAGFQWKSDGMIYLPGILC